MREDISPVIPMEENEETHRRVFEGDGPRCSNSELV